MHSRNAKGGGTMFKSGHGVNHACPPFAFDVDQLEAAMMEIFLIYLHSLEEKAS